MIKAIFLLVGLMFYSLIKIHAVEIARSGQYLLEEALQRYRETECLKMNYRTDDKKTAITLYTYHPNTDFYSAYRRTESRPIKNTPADIPKGVTISGNNRLFVCLPTSSLAIHCAFRSPLVPAATPSPVTAPPQEFVSVESRSRTIDGKHFQAITVTFDDRAIKYMEEKAIDPYYALYGLYVKSNVKRNYKLRQLRYLIEEESLNIFEWQLIGDDRLVVMEEIFDQVTPIAQFNFQELFQVPASYRTVVAETSKELNKLLSTEIRYAEKRDSLKPASSAMSLWKWKGTLLATTAAVALGAVCLWARRRRASAQ